METLSKTEKVKEILKTMTVTELEEITEQTLALRGLRFYHFLDLPAELRNMIYLLAIKRCSMVLQGTELYHPASKFAA